MYGVAKLYYKRRFSGCMKNLVLKIIRGSYPPPSPKYSYDLRNLIASLLKKRPDERPALNIILNKKFMRKSEQRHLGETVAKRGIGGRVGPEAIYLSRKSSSRIGIPSCKPVKNM